MGRATEPRLEGEVTHGHGSSEGVRAAGQHEPAAELLRIERDLAVALAEFSDMQVAAKCVLEAIFRIPGFDCGGFYLLEPTSGGLRLVQHAACRGNLWPA